MSDTYADVYDSAIYRLGELNERNRIIKLIEEDRYILPNGEPANEVPYTHIIALIKGEINEQ